MSELDEEVSSLADRVSSWVDLLGAIEKSRGEVESPAWQSLIWAFQYDLVWPASSTRLSNGFSSMVTFADGRSIPPVVRDVPEAVVEGWKATLNARHPVIRSRVADLLVVHGTDRGTCLPVAIDSYLQMADLPWDTLEQSQALGRALVLARDSRAVDRVDRITDILVSRLIQWMNAGEAPGVTIPLIEQLADLPAPVPTVIDLIGMGLAQYGGNPHHASSLLAKKYAISPRDEQDSISRERVEVWIEAAAAADSTVRVLHLQTAAQLADELGLAEQRGRVSSLLQEAGANGHDFERITTEVDLPRAAVDEYLAAFATSDSWRTNLDRVCLHAPISGNLNRNREQVAELARAAPLSAIFPRVRLGGDGLPRWTAETEDDLAEARLSQVEELNIKVGAPLLARGLYLVQPDEVVREELESYWMGHPNMEDRVASLLAQGLDLYWRRESSAAAALMIPTIEALARRLVVASGEGVYRVQRKAKPGQYPGLGTLLDSLAQLGWDESWIRYVRTAFASSRGMNLRNEWAHGFSGPLSDSVAAMALHVAGHLSMLSVGTTSTS